MKSDRKEEILAEIEKIGDLPTLPEIALKVSNLVEDPDSNVSDIVSVIRNDPSLTSKILKISNSAFYGMLRRIESLNMALVVLGMREINSLVTAISVLNAFPREHFSVEFDYAQFWIHSAGVGEVAKLMGRRLGFREESSIFTAGLLHDLGKIVLAKYFLDDFVKCLELSSNKGITMQEAELQVLGADHAEIGAWLAEQWGLPQFLSQIIHYHHDIKDATSFQHETALVHLANTFCKAMDFGFGGDRIHVSITEDPAWDILLSKKPDLAEFDLERFTFEIESEIKNAHEFLEITYY